jgi:hypothetical protein
MEYVWDTFDTYRLSKETLVEFLKKLFGPYDFYVNVSETLSYKNLGY